MMFVWPAALTFLVGVSRSRGSIAGWISFFLGFVVLIGLRTETGGDWFPYNDLTEIISFQSLGNALSSSEFGFAFVTWVSTRLGWGVYGVTTFCGTVLMYAVIK